MEYEITNRPSFAELVATLDEGDRIRLESSSLVSHTQGVEITSNDRGGLTASLKETLLGDDATFSTVLTANRPGTVTVAPPFPGDIVHYELREETLYVQSCSFLAAQPDVEFDAEFSRDKTFVENESDFLLELTGSGLSFMASYGAISVVSLDPGETYVVDTGHVVAFEETVDFSVRRVEGVKSLRGTEEGCLAEFEGPGTIWTQSRSPSAVLAWLVPNLSDEP
ncbi:TIGR00266 family protein [Haladaptatus salinisoli]|uniref:TIGR00266 family protein n=1 Tax=Haladaptatus salinisoli TaxID=2884876 RepID=UPI001D0BC991|nr:TIGR00266 family protein [Haladaptatus salinisoli]